MQVTGCPYQSEAFPTPGTGTLSIAELASDQTAQKTRTGGRPVLLKGSQFVARFVVEVKAQTATEPPGEDPTPEYPGTGAFVTRNSQFRGT